MKSHAAAATAAAVALIGIVGIWLFAVSLRPCRIKLRPGQLVEYRLTTEWTAISADDSRGEPSVNDHEIDLICIGSDNEVALLNPGEHGQRDEITLLDFAPDGSARRFDPTTQVHDDGKALGFFDFNLLPLPPGSDQSWNVSLVYAALPADRRQVQGKVRRLANGSRPTFKLSLPTVEWINDDRRWQQIKDLCCTYRFDTARGVVESATVECQAGIERADGYHRYHVRTDLALVGVTAGKDEPIALRDLALATAEAQDAFTQHRDERLTPALQRLRANPATNLRLRAVVDRLLEDIRRGGSRADDGARRQQQQQDQRLTEDRRTLAAEGDARGRWAVQAGSAPLKSRSSADRLATSLSAAGFPAHVVAKARNAVVLVGPYDEQDPALLGSLRKRLGKAKPFWVKLD